MRSSEVKDASSVSGREFGRHHVRSHSSPAAFTTLLSSASASTADDPFHLPDYLLRSVSDPKLQSLLRDCFLVADEGSRLCSSLLISIHHVRRQYQNLSELLRHSDTDRLKLSSYLKLDNPLELFRFHQVHDKYSSLFTRLTVSRNKIKRKIKLLRVFTHTSGVVLLMVCSGLSVAVLIAATHGMICAVAAVFAPPSWFRWMKSSLRQSRTIRQERQVEAAAKGAYIVKRGLETMGSIMARLHCEIEHRKDIVRMFLRSGDERRYLRGMDDWVLEELKELEGQVFWCLGTISRSRKLLAHELPCRQ